MQPTLAGRQSALLLDGYSINRRVPMNPVLYRLMRTHARIDAEVRREHKRRFPDSFRLLRLKKVKLAVKDRIHRLLQGRKPGIA